MSDPVDLRVVQGGGGAHPGLDLPPAIEAADWREIGSSLAREQRAADIEWRIGDWAARADGDLAKPRRGRRHRRRKRGKSPQVCRHRKGLSANSPANRAGILPGIPHMEPSQPIECDSKPLDVQFAFE